MLSIAPPPTIYLHAGATDMRKSFDGLSGIIRGSFGGDPADGSLFLFGVRPPQPPLHALIASRR